MTRILHTGVILLGTAAAAVLFLIALAMFGTAYLNFNPEALLYLQAFLPEDYSIAEIFTGNNPSPTVPATQNPLAEAYNPFPPTATNTPFQPIPPTVTASLTPIPSETPTPTPTYTETTVPTTEIAATQTASLQPTSDTWPPLQAQVSGVPGHGMYYNLDCETRSAVDWAAFFGTQIDHNEYLSRLPYTDDPETGYVGHYNDLAGNIPPLSYGVHAPPIAALLQEYGVSAHARRNLPFDEIKEEVASGRPVIVWVIGSVVNGTPVSYTAASTGNTTLVAAYEHTVLFTGYDENYVTIQDGKNVYYRTHGQFLKSWGVLGNMAVTAD